MEFGSWLRQSDSPLPQAASTFLDVAGVDCTALSQKDRHQIISRDGFMNRMGALIQWCFVTHAEAIKHEERDGGNKMVDVITTISELSPLANMAKGDIWQHFYVRQFFLVQAPLESFIELYEVHRAMLRNQRIKSLALPGGLLLREYVWRGRFHDAVEAYMRLKVSNSERRSFTAMLFEYEQYAMIRELYRLQELLDRDQARTEPLLDPLFLLQSLHALGERDEMLERFDQLPRDQQIHPEMQKLIADA